MPTYYYYCCLEAQLTMTNYYKYHYSVSASLKLPQDIKHTDSWANGRLITTTLYLADLINSTTTSADIVVSWQGCCYCLLLLIFCQLHDFTFLLLYFISMYTAYVPLQMLLIRLWNIKLKQTNKYLIFHFLSNCCVPCKKYVW